MRQKAIRALRTTTTCGFVAIGRALEGSYSRREKVTLMKAPCQMGTAIGRTPSPGASHESVVSVGSGLGRDDPENPADHDSTEIAP
jgi:hypothetical protein